MKTIQCVYCIDATAANILASKFLVVMEIMTKHYGGQFFSINKKYAWLLAHMLVINISLQRTAQYTGVAEPIQQGW